MKYALIAALFLYPALLCLSATIYSCCDKDAAGMIALVTHLSMFTLLWVARKQ